MRLILSVLLFFGMSLELLAQSDTSSKQLQDVVIYANKFPTLSKNIVQRVVALTDKVLLKKSWVLNEGHSYTARLRFNLILEELDLDSASLPK